MAKYKVWVRCAACGDMHPVPGIVDLDDGPATKMALRDAYKGRVPPALKPLVEGGTKCPKCGERFCPRKEYVFLVPSPDGSAVVF
jgi:hypothetical protein